MNKLKATAFLLAAVMLLSVAGCRKDNKGLSSAEPPVISSQPGKDHLTLLYSASDTFNPYTAKTSANRQLCKLLYEPLIKLDNAFNPSNCIAESVDLKGKKCSVRLKKVTFSDGSAVSAGDVVYSYNLAKASATSYASKLYEVISVSAADSQTVVFNLIKADPFFANVLDFPILKTATENVTNSDSVLLPPVGCGRYRVSDDRLSLVRNDKYFGNAAAVNKIQLINAPDNESLAHYVEIGAADFFYSDISDGQILRMSGEKVNINLNNLVYIGVNKAYGDLAENALRQAISSGLARNIICRDAYYNNASAATGFFNPLWNPVKSVQNIQTEANKEITVENLEKIGYNNLDSNGCRRNNGGAALKFSLLVNSENNLRVAAAQLIASQLAEYGIIINVVKKPYADYIASLAAGDFQLYLAEVAITDNMDISSLVIEGGSAAYGVSNAPPLNPDGTPQEITTLADIINGFYGEANTITDVASILQTEMPIIPVCYRNGVLFYNDNIENVINSSASDIYFSIDSYKFKNK